MLLLLLLRGPVGTVLLILHDFAAPSCPAKGTDISKLSWVSRSLAGIFSKSGKLFDSQASHLWLVQFAISLIGLSTVSSSSIKHHHCLNLSKDSNATMNALTRPLRSRSGDPAWNLVSRRFSQPTGIARHLTLDRKWSHPPSTTNIADDEVASLASQPLHALSLADLVKCDTLSSCHYSDLLTYLQTRTPSALYRSPLFIS